MSPPIIFRCANAARVNELAVQLKQQGLLVIYITHDIFQIHRIADRIVIMENGRKVADVLRDAMSAEALEEIIRDGGRAPRRGPKVNEASRLQQICHGDIRKRALSAMVVLISLGFAVITHGRWLSVGNLQSLSQFTAVLAIMAFGEAIVIATGEIDISVGSTAESGH